MNNNRIIIMGVGNILLGDEGFGVHALHYLMEHYKWPDNIKLVDGGTSGLMLMADLLECDLVIILDIARGGGEPGSFYKLENENLAKDLSICHSSHQTSIEDVLINCELVGHRPQAVIFAMEPFNYQNMAPALTKEANARLPLFCEKVLNQLALMDIRPTPLS